jgi:hypothetical protein
MVSSGWFLQEPHGVTTQKTPFFKILRIHNTNTTIETARTTELTTLPVPMEM